MKETEVYGCSDVWEFLGIPEAHCDSCHDDMDEGYSAGWIEIEDREIEVCCRAMEAWDASRSL